MVSTFETTHPQDEARKGGFVVHPQKFALWLSFASICMLFAGITSAYIVRKGMGNWVDFPIPSAFTISTFVIILSSLTMHWAFKSFRAEKLSQYRIALGLTLALGLGFIASQWAGWQALMNMGVFLQGNPSGSFLYVISLAHVVHVAGGMLFLIVAFLRSLFYFKNPANMLIYNVDEHKRVKIELLATYWHFVDLLWLYLFVFLVFNHL